MRVLTLLGVLSLLVLTLGFGLDVGVAALFASLVLVAFRPAIQKPALQGVAWSAILLVTGIVTYVGVLEKMGAITELQSGIATLGGSAIATLVTCYVVGFVSAFASTTGTLGAILPLVVPLATDPALTPVGVVTAISIASSVVDVSPMSTSGALLMASAEPKDEALFFRALLVYAITMIGIVPLVVWLVFVRSGLF
jgi:di/tricarboxylate transporter